MEKMKGFEFEGKRIYFMDGRGKDISFERWRVSLYYNHHQAATHFLPSQAEYDAFLTEHQADCYDDYDKFRAQEEHSENCNQD